MMTWLFAASLLLAPWLYAEIWKKAAAGRVQAELRWPEAPVVEGSRHLLEIHIENRSWVPAPYLRVEIGLPEELEAETDGAPDQLTYTVWLLPRQKTVVKYPLHFSRRGMVTVQWISVFCHEGFGLRKLFRQEAPPPPIVVRPRPLPRESLSLRMTDWIGEIQVRRWHQEDPACTIGVRPWVSGDPLKLIHWKASARTGTWLARQLSATTECRMNLLINLQTRDPYWLGTPREIVDEMCRLAMALSGECLRLGGTVGLFSNGSWKGKGCLTVAPGSSGNQLSRIGEALGCLLPQAKEPFLNSLERWAADWKETSSVILITPVILPGIQRGMRRLERAGHAVCIIEAAPPDVLSSLESRREEERGWPNGTVKSF
jgi:uncharacterized protein (DUF58 family)